MTRARKAPDAKKNCPLIVHQRAKVAPVLRLLSFIVVLITISYLVTNFHRYEMALLFFEAPVTGAPHGGLRQPVIHSQGNYKVHFLNQTQLSELDGFSASWIQRKQDFMEMNLERIGICEDAAFEAFSNVKGRGHKMRMTLDWLDFGVEHMSKWWKLLDWSATSNPVPYHRITEQFTEYVSGASQHDSTGDNHSILRETLAVVAFQRYENEGKPEWGYDLTMKSLAATLESLRRVGFSRVVVSTLSEDDSSIIQDSFQFMLSHLQAVPRKRSEEPVAKIGHMEVGWALAKEEHGKTKWLAKNVPRATLLGLKDAFVTSQLDKDVRDKEMVKAMDSWLGTNQDPSYWKYIYLTEPDTILATKLQALPGIKAELDKGSVILPHRLQPMPHGSDLVGMSNERGQYLDGDEFNNVMELDSYDACCDENKGPDFKPGLPPQIDDCGNFWYMCGFGPNKNDTDDHHIRLKPYNLIRLREGTGIVSLAGSEHGRRCLPQKKGTCKLRL